MLFKYRSLANFKHFVDAILNQRLYAARYSDLNDPMEGIYHYGVGHAAEDLVRKLRGEKSRLGICSLSRTPSNQLMWAHYANGHRGVVLGVEVDRNVYEIRPVQYGEPLALLNDPGDLIRATAIEILSHKPRFWEYEEEERVFVEQDHFVSVRICEVWIGSRMSAGDEQLVRELIRRGAPDVRIVSARNQRIA